MVEFYHYLFYRASNYYKDKNLPVYSPVILITFFICLNYITVFNTINYFVYHDRWPSYWDYWMPLIVIFVFNYWYFSRNSRWKSVVKWGDKMPRTEKRERNIYYWVYIAITVLLLVVTMYIVKENVFRLYPNRSTLPANVHINQEEGVIIYKPDFKR